MGALWAAGLLLRRLRAEAGPILLLVTLVAATSFLFAGAPRLLNLVADGALVHELGAAPTVERNFQLSSVSVIASEPDPLQTVDDVGAAYLDLFPDSLRALIDERHVSATTARFEIEEPPSYALFMALRYQDGLDGEIRIVDGRMPESTGEQLPLADIGFIDPPPLGESAPTPVEVAVSEATAAETGLTVGAALIGTVDGTDPVLRGVLLRKFQVEFQVVGIFAIENPAADVWYADRTLQRADIFGTDEFPIAYATALVAPAAYADLATAELPFRFAWRYFIAPERADVAQLAAIVPELRRLQSRSASETFQAGDLAFQTGLLDVIGRYQAQRAASEAVLSVAAIGPFALAVGAIAMVAITLVVRRRASLELARSRGASGLLILGAQLWEGALLAGAAAMIGLLVAILVVPGRDAPASAWLALATGAAAGAVLVAATVPAARRALGRVHRADPPVLPASPRRLVLEVTGVGLAIAGVVLLQQRGLVIGGGAGGEVARFDPFLAAVPVLAGLATGVVAMRLYPAPIRAVGWLAARRRDLVPVLGLRTVGRHSATANLPLLVLMLTAAFGAFASVVMSSVDSGQVDEARAQVGADYRIEVGAGGGARDLDLSDVAGAEAVAAAHVDPSATFSDRPALRSQVVFHAIEPEAYSLVTAGTPIDPDWPAAFVAAPSGSAVGTLESPIPAIVSLRPPSGSQSLTPGTPFAVTVGTATTHIVNFVVVERRATFPGVRSDAAFVVAPLELVQAAMGSSSLPPTVLLLRGPPEIESTLTSYVAERSPSSSVTSRYGRYATLRQAPFVAMVTGGFRIAVGVAVAYATLAIIAAMTLTAARRSQDLAFLRTLGLSGRQAAALTIVEHGPPVVLALLPGITLGIVLAAILAPGLGLAAFIGPGAAFGIQVRWGEIALVGAGLVIMVAVASVTGTRLARRARVVDALRVGAE